MSWLSGSPFSSDMVAGISLLPALFEARVYDGPLNPSPRPERRSRAATARTTMQLFRSVRRGDLGRAAHFLDLFPADVAGEAGVIEEHDRAVADEQVLGVLQRLGRAVQHGVGLVDVVAGVQDRAPDLQLAL